MGVIHGQATFSLLSQFTGKNRHIMSRIKLLVGYNLGIHTHEFCFHLVPFYLIHPVNTPFASVQLVTYKDVPGHHAQYVPLLVNDCRKSPHQVIGGYVFMQFRRNRYLMLDGMGPDYE
ncbi:MAG: hypothetical protein BWY80_01434 [Firmicutes bacterium ADurb.Bin456]|nr:MAG: hypothetical protein BWY80_01434 [Firmicutes bacterium ADurb.Bin456]